MKRDKKRMTAYKELINERGILLAHSSLLGDEKKAQNGMTWELVLIS